MVRKVRHLDLLDLFFRLFGRQVLTVLLTVFLIIFSVKGFSFLSGLFLDEDSVIVETEKEKKYAVGRIYFEAKKKEGFRQIYSYDIESKVLNPITDWSVNENTDFNFVGKDSKQHAFIGRTSNTQKDSADSIRPIISNLIDGSVIYPTTPAIWGEEGLTFNPNGSALAFSYTLSGQSQGVRP